MNDLWIDGAALERFASEGTDLHRIYSSPESSIERYGDDVLFALRRDDEARELRADLEKWSAEHGFTPARIFVKRLQQNPGAEKYTLLAGDPSLPLETVCSEMRLRYKIDFGAGYSNGFFIDQRENRRFLRELRPATVLNCFAYTCSFSVVAASAGAETWSVDLAKRALEWGRGNFELNGIAQKGKHRFWPDDVRDVLRRQTAKGQRFSAVILDPPTFSRNAQGKVFRVEDELPELAAQVFPLVEPGGHLLLSTNCERLSLENLEAFAEGAARSSGRSWKTVSVPAPEDIPQGQGAVGVWVKVG